MVDMNTEQLDKVRSGKGFFAALDQSGGSTPKALAGYGIDPSDYDGDTQMFDLVHQMRTRVVTDPAFDGDRVLAAILFEQTMDRDVEGVPTGEYLWQRKQIVPFLKVDKGLADAADGVQVMKPIDTLPELIDRALAHRMLGTKMRSVVHEANPKGVDAVVDQQFEVGDRIAAAGLVPILEPEVSIDCPDKVQAEHLLHDAIARRLTTWDDRPLMLKLTIPDEVGRYADLAQDPRVVRVLALSGGYSRDEASGKLAVDPSMIASFSRALLDGLTAQQTDEEFTDTLDASVGEIYAASTHQVL